MSAPLYLDSAPWFEKDKFVTQVLFVSWEARLMSAPLYLNGADLMTFFLIDGRGGGGGEEDLWLWHGKVDSCLHLSTLPELQYMLRDREGREEGPHRWLELIKDYKDFGR